MFRKTDKFHIDGVERVDGNGVAGSVGADRIIRLCFSELVKQQPQHSTDTEQNAVFFKELLKSASTIEADGNLLWDATQVTENSNHEWDRATKDRFNEALKQFQHFDPKNPIESFGKQNHLHANFNHGLILLAQQAIDQNYELCGKKGVFPFQPCPSEFTSLKITRHGNVFAFRFTGQLLTLRADDMKMYEYSKHGRLKDIQSNQFVTHTLPTELHDESFLAFNTASNKFIELKKGQIDGRILGDHFLLYSVTTSKFYAIYNDALVEVDPSRRFYLYDIEKQKFLKGLGLSAMNRHNARVTNGEVLLYEPATDAYFAFSSDKQKIQPIDGKPNVEKGFLFYNKIKQQLSLPQCETCSGLEFYTLDDRLHSDEYFLYEHETLSFYQQGHRGLVQVDAPELSAKHDLQQEAIALLHELNVRGKARADDAVIDGSLYTPAAHLKARAFIPYQAEPIADYCVEVEMKISPHGHIKGTLDIQISTDNGRSDLLYIGTKHATEVFQIQHTLPGDVPDKTPNKKTLINARRSLAVKSFLKLVNIVCKWELEPAAKSPVFLLDLMHLFNEAIRRVLLDRLFETNSERAVVPEFLHELAESVLSDTLPFSKLCEETESGLMASFCQIEPRKLFILDDLLGQEQLAKRRADLVSLWCNPNRLSASLHHVEKPARIRAVAYLLIVALDTIHNAVKNAISHRELMRQPARPQQVFTMDIPSEPPEWCLNLVTRILEGFKDNPFNERLHINPYVQSSIMTDLSQPLPSQGAINRSVSPDIELETHVVDIIGSLPRPTGKILLPARRERISALLTRNPFIQGLLDLSPRYAIQQMLTLYPATRVANPYFVIPGIFGATTGIILASKWILNPNTNQSRPVRYWSSATNGLVVLVFGMNAVINIYLATHPENGEVSNELFWTQLAPAPIVLAGVYTFWNALARETKERWIKRSWLRNTIEVASKSLFAAGAFELFLLQIIVGTPGKNLGLHAIPLTAALSLSMLHPTRFRETGQTLVSHLAAFNFGYLLIRDIARYTPEDPNQAAWSHYTRIVFWALALIYSLYFTLRYGSRFVQTYEGDPEFVVQRFRPGQALANERTLLLSSDAQRTIAEPPTTEDEREQHRSIAFQYERHRSSHSQRYSDFSDIPDIAGQKKEKRICQIM